VIDKSIAAEIVRLHRAEHWPVTTIATALAVHHSVVERVLGEDGVPEARPDRPSKLDAYLPFIDQTLSRHPRLCASRLFHMCAGRGYVGSESHFRRVVGKRRPRKAAEAYLRLRALPGEQAQVDWGCFGKVKIGRAERRLIAFVLVLAYSRMIFLRFFLGDHTENFLRGHVAAFCFFGGCVRTVLYDNLKSAVLERRADAIRFNPRIVELSRHYCFEPRPVAVARGNEKGRVERAIRYIRSSFFAAREWSGLEDLNAQALLWCEGTAAERPWPDDRSRTVREVFEKDEKARLLELPGDDFVCDERREVAVGKTPYVRFDNNDYSVPADCVRRTLTVVASLDQVRICEGSKVVAQHRRSFDRGAQIEDLEHIETLVKQKEHARKHRGLDRLAHAVPSSQELIAALAERGDNIGSAVSWMLRLLDSFGPKEVELATREAIEHGIPHPQAVRHILDRRRREAGRMPNVPVGLPNDPRVRDLSVRPHDLSGYDRLVDKTNEEEGGAADEQ